MPATSSSLSKQNQSPASPLKDLIAVSAAADVFASVAQSEHSKENVSNNKQQLYTQVNDEYTTILEGSTRRLRQYSDHLKQSNLTVMDRRHHQSAHLHGLMPGSRFVGEQKNKQASYCVNVSVQDVDVQQSVMCGYLTIVELTEQHPTITTYFDGEIIDGRQFHFLTRKWETESEIDKDHWTHFSTYQRLEHDLDEGINDETLPHRLAQCGHIFMRWKERFLVPDHTIKSLNGASFAGFYYIDYDVAAGTINGFYYHKNSELYQKIKLSLVTSQITDSFEFR